MIEVQNAFARNLMFWLLTLPFLYLFLAPALSDVKSMDVPRSEMLLLHDLGQDSQLITQRTNEAFAGLFVTTGVVQWTQKLFGSKLKFSRSPTGVKNSAKANNTYLENFWKLIYRGMWRIIGLGPILVVLMIAMVVPAVVDGLVVHTKKMDVFKPRNPVFFWASAHTAISTIGVFLVLPILPFAISLFVLYGSVLLIAISMWVAASNMQTGS